MAENFDHLTVLPSIESHNDPERMLAVVRHAIDAHPALVGIYSMGSGNRTLLQALRDSGRAHALTVIAHELTPLSRQALIDGEMDAVITQNVGHLVRSALRVLRAKCDGLDLIESQERIRTDIVIRENLP